MIALPGMPVDHKSKELQPYVYHPSLIPAVWDELEAMLHRSFEHAKGTIDPKQVYKWLCDEDAVAFATTREGRLEMAMVVMKVDYAQYSVVRIIACAGKNLKGAMNFVYALEAWALTQGCVELEAWCRPAMVRLTRRLGWEPKFMIVSRDLRRKLQ